MAETRRTPTRRPAAPRNAGGGWLAPLFVYAGAGLVLADLYQRKKGRDAERADPPRGRFLAAGGARLHYVDIGRGRPVVLIHGIGTTLDDWFLAGVAGMLARGNRVVAVDRPGSGYASRPGGDWSPERQADAIAVLLRRLGAEDAVVVGHSFGCLVALALAVRHPRAVHAAVLVAPPAAPGAPAFEMLAHVPEVPLLSGLARATVTPSAARALAPRVYERLFEPQPVTEAFRAGYPLDLVCRPAQLKAAEDDARGADAALVRLFPAAAALPVPFAVVAGSGDAIFDPDRHARPLAAILDAALAIVPAGGHMVHHSFPGAVVGVIRDALADRLPRSAGPDDAADDPRTDPASAEPEGPGEGGAGAPADAPAKQAARRRPARSSSSRTGKGKDDAPRG